MYRQFFLKIPNIESHDHTSVGSHYSLKINRETRPWSFSLLSISEMIGGEDIKKEWWTVMKHVKLEYVHVGTFYGEGRGRERN